jgi:hypothetical protein
VPAAHGRRRMIIPGSRPMLRNYGARDSSPSG